MRSPIVTSLRNAALSSAFLAASWVLASPGTAVAQQIAPPPPPMAAPPPPPPPPAAAPGYMFDMSSMGKAWGEMLKSYGIYLNGGFETNFYSVVSGGRKTGNLFQGEDTLGADLDLNRMFGIAGAAIHISTDDRWGPNPRRFYGSNIGTTANQGPTVGYRLAELSWDQDLFNDHVRLLVGRIGDNVDFSSSELYCRFLFSICGNGGAFWYFNHQLSSYPLVQWGGRVTIKPSLPTYLRFGAFEENPEGLQANKLGWPGEEWGLKHAVGVFLPVEIGYKTNFDQDPFPRGIDVGGYYDSARYTDPFGHPQQGRSAVYMNAQQMVYRPDMTSKRGLTVFGVAMLDTSNAGPIAEQFTGGLSWVGPFAGRPADSLQLGAIYSQLNRSVAQTFVTGCLANPAYSPSACRAETRAAWELELNYTYALAPGVSIIPVVAYFINPVLGPGFPGLTIPPTFTRAKNAWLVGAQLAIGLNGAFGLPSFIRTN